MEGRASPNTIQLRRSGGRRKAGFTPAFGPLYLCVFKFTVLGASPILSATGLHDPYAAFLFLILKGHVHLWALQIWSARQLSGVKIPD